MVVLSLGQATKTLVYVSKQSNNADRLLHHTQVPKILGPVRTRPLSVRGQYYDWKLAVWKLTIDGETQFLTVHFRLFNIRDEKIWRFLRESL